MTSNFTCSFPEMSCPYIGFKNDLQTTLSYPSVRNYCHLRQLIVMPNFSYQGEFCLTPKYCECPAFLAKENTPMPEELLDHDRKHSDKQKNPIIRILFLIVLLFFLLFSALTIETRAAEESSASGSCPVAESSLIAASQTDPGIESIGPIRIEIPVELSSLEES